MFTFNLKIQYFSEHGDNGKTKWLFEKVTTFLKFKSNALLVTWKK